MPIFTPRDGARVALPSSGPGKTARKWPVYIYIHVDICLLVCVCVCVCVCKIKSGNLPWNRHQETTTRPKRKKERKKERKRRKKENGENRFKAEGVRPVSFSPLFPPFFLPIFLGIVE